MYITKVTQVSTVAQGPLVFHQDSNFCTGLLRESDSLSDNGKIIDVYIKAMQFYLSLFKNLM